MLLNELVAPKRSGISRFNRYLKECYGYSINSGVSTGQLKRLYSVIAEDLYNLKLDGLTPKDPQYARKLAVHEGVKEILRQRQITEARVGPGADVFKRVCSKLSQYACDCINTGDSEDHAVGKAMDVYRSSKYRFPDSEVEDEIRECIWETFGASVDTPEPARPEKDTLMDGEYEERRNPEDIQAAVEAAIYGRLHSAHPEVFDEFEPADIVDAVAEVAEYHNDAEEIGGSDVSIFVNQVFDTLGRNRTGIAEDPEHNDGWEGDDFGAFSTDETHGGSHWSRVVTIEPYKGRYDAVVFNHEIAPKKAGPGRGLYFKPATPGEVLYVGGSDEVQEYYDYIPEGLGIVPYDQDGELFAVTHEDTGKTLWFVGKREDCEDFVEPTIQETTAGAIAH